MDGRRLILDTRYWILDGWMRRGGDGESCKVYCEIRDKKIETEPAVVLECGIRGAGEQQC